MLYVSNILYMLFVWVVYINSTYLRACGFRFAAIGRCWDEIYVFSVLELFLRDFSAIPFSDRRRISVSVFSDNRGILRMYISLTPPMNSGFSGREVE